jgi:hypothetical protein
MERTFTYEQPWSLVVSLPGVGDDVAISAHESAVDLAVQPVTPRRMRVQVKVHLTTDEATRMPTRTSGGTQLRMKGRPDHFPAARYLYEHSYLTPIPENLPPVFRVLRANPTLEQPRVVIMPERLIFQGTIYAVITYVPRRVQG